MEDKNGILTDICLDSEHLYTITNRKHLGLYDILQEKKLGGYFNDYRNINDDRLPNDKELTCIITSQESTMVLVGTSAGNIYVLRSWHCIHASVNFQQSYYKSLVVLLQPLLEVAVLDPLCHALLTDFDTWQARSDASDRISTADVRLTSIFYGLGEDVGEGKVVEFAIFGSKV